MMERNFKFQAPSSRETSSSKLQVPTADSVLKIVGADVSRRISSVAGRLAPTHVGGYAAWDADIHSLELEAWSLNFL